MKTIIIVILFLLLYSSASPQSERLSGMGNLRIAVPDKHSTFNPYDFGNNPAYLIEDEKESYLKIIPSYSAYSGDYKRYYDPASENLYRLKFSGIKTLEEDGTFLGETSYEYSFREDVPRSLRYNTYGGQAFFLTDTATGDFRYNGPLVKFSYSFETLDDLFAGASVKYRILDGLKRVYSRAEILFREIETNIGFVYKLNDTYAFGVNYIYLDDQEKIESKSEELLDVELFQYRGETYSVMKRAGSVSQKIKGSGHKFSAQLYQNNGFIETGLTGSVNLHNQKVLIPLVTTAQSFNEYEEGYSSFNTVAINLGSRYRLSDAFTVGLSGEYFRNYFWSKNSAKEKLLWELQVNNIDAGIGISWKVIPSFLLGVEYNYSNLNADSSKYIDSRYADIQSGNHFIKAGAEYEIVKNIFLRGGYNLSSIEKDIVYGGENVSISRVTAGFGIYTIPSLAMDIQFEYGFYTGLPGVLKRSILSGYTTVKLFTF